MYSILQSNCGRVTAANPTNTTQETVLVNVVQTFNLLSQDSKFLSISIPISLSIFPYLSRNVLIASYLLCCLYILLRLLTGFQRRVIRLLGTVPLLIKLLSTVHNEQLLVSVLQTLSFMATEGTLFLSSIRFECRIIFCYLNEYSSIPQL